MSRTGHGITEMIKKELKDGEKTGGYLKVTVLNKKNPKKSEERNVQKAFKRALNKLLETEEIEIIGYKKTGKIRQAFDEQSILFQLSKIKSPAEINLLLRQLESLDEKKIKNAKIELNNIFKKKYKQYEEETDTKTSEELDVLFNEVLFYINTQENQNFLRQGFSWALSNEKDSEIWFNLLITESQSQIKGLLDGLSWGVY